MQDFVRKENLLARTASLAPKEAVMSGGVLPSVEVTDSILEVAGL